jgi:hypothetical protein
MRLLPAAMTVAARGKLSPPPACPEILEEQPAVKRGDDRKRGGASDNEH